MNNSFTEKDLLLADLTIKLTAIERLLVKKNLITIEEIVEEMKIVSKEIINYINTNNNN